MIAHLCKWALETFHGERIVMIVASKELCEQNFDKLLRVWPDAPAGILSASIGHKRTDDAIIFGTIGTVYRNAAQLGRRSLVIIDECHNVNPANAGM
jgi:DNA repair protein RadD